MMKKNVWMNVLLAIAVAGLFLTVSCAKKTVVTDAGSIQDQASVDAEAKAKDGKIQADSIDEQMAKERALAQAKAAAAKNRFENQNIHFEYDSDVLTAMAKQLLKEKAAWLMANSGVSVLIEGHCDERGTTEYNLALGERRATAAKAYLVNLGVAASRLDIISYGEEKPLDTSGTEEAYRKNRRAQFVLQ